MALLAACGGGPAPGGNDTGATVAKPGIVSDAADLIPAAEEASLAARLGAFEARTRQQLVVATVPALDGRDMDEVAEELGKRLGISDGVLMLIALRERQARIAVGAGAMRLLTNGEATHILDVAMAPDLRANRFDKGIIKGADAIMSELSETVA